ncbi:hypothetical protein B566_EDAN001675 [Ephemera danica]|nr:hypothetical protein B566_EDAN001675 [Ephemera danica]
MNKKPQHHIKPKWSRTRYRVTFVAVLFLLVEFGWVPGVQTGFYCDDPSIAYRYDGDTIRITVLLLVSFFVPLLAMWVVESGCCFCPAVAAGARAKRGLRHAWVWYREYLLGLVFTLLIVDVAKVIVGEPRPHFLDSCKPDVALDAAACKAAASPSGYVENFKCTNEELSSYVVNDSTRSFPSGHAAVGVYGALFLISLCVVWAMVCSFTRISDHRHHAHDVAVGAFIGALVAALLIRNYCGGFWPGQCPARLQEESTSAGEYSTSGDRAVDGEEERGRENGHATGRHPHQSMRRLLSSTSSYSGSITCNDEPASREVNPA